MPIEIKELHIRVAVNVSQSGQSPESHPASSDSMKSDAGETDKDAIVAECVEQVLQILQHKKER